MKFSLWTIPSLLKIPIGFIHAFYLLIKIRPRIVVSFGGYTSYPVVVIAALFKIPVLVHEQTVVAGRANLKAARFAQKIAISRTESRKYFPAGKTILVGNPVSAEIRSIKPKVRKGNPLVLFFAGGSRGSVALNNAVNESLEDLLKTYIVVHQTGDLELSKFEQVKKKLNNKVRDRYKVIGLVPQWEWYKYIKMADIIISRSGANVVSELIITKKPCILIPLPFAYLDEQLLNAKFAQKFGLATILLQKDLTTQSLYTTINHVNKQWTKIVKSVSQKQTVDTNASSKIVDLIEEMVS